MAQLDNATDSDSGEREFKSLRADQKTLIAFCGERFLCGLSVERQNSCVEVGRKGDPYDIRDLQIGSGFADAAEIDRHRDDQHEEQYDPDQREEIVLAVEENNAPEEIKHDLCKV